MVLCAAALFPSLETKMAPNCSPGRILCRWRDGIEHGRQGIKEDRRGRQTRWKVKVGGGRISVVSARDRQQGQSVQHKVRVIHFIERGLHQRPKHGYSQQEGEGEGD